MTQATDTDIRELKDLILGLDRKIEAIDKKVDVGFAKLEGKIDNVEAKLTGRIDNVEAKLEGKIDTANARLTNLETNTKNITDLAEKLGELKNWKQIAFYLFTAVVSGAIGGVVGWFVRSGGNR
jgi:chromosome segregation ATPase